MGAALFIYYLELREWKKYYYQLGGGSADIVRTIEGGLARGVLGVYKEGGWVKKDLKRAYVICTQPLSLVLPPA